MTKKRLEKENSQGISKKIEIESRRVVPEYRYLSLFRPLLESYATKEQRFTLSQHVGPRAEKLVAVEQDRELQEWVKGSGQDRGGRKKSKGGGARN